MSVLLTLKNDRSWGTACPKVPRSVQCRSRPRILDHRPFRAPVKAPSANRLWRRLRASGRPVVFLDGDKLRDAIAEDLGHPINDRQRSAMRNGRLCRLLAEQGIDVVCATISMFHEVQRWNRAHIPGYFEIYLRVPMAEIQRRDPKGIYARARAGEAANVVGIDIAAEEPEAPDLVLENYGAARCRRRG